MDFYFGGWSIIWDALVHTRISGIGALHQKMDRCLSGFLGYHLQREKNEQGMLNFSEINAHFVR